MLDLKVLKDTPPWEWPPSAGKLFHRLLRDPGARAEDRLIAAELAGDFTAINDQLAGDLMAIVKNPIESAELRVKAAISFGAALEAAATTDFDDPDDVPISVDIFHQAQELLRTVHSDTSTPKEVRRRTLEASVRAPEDWHEDAVSAAYASPDREWKLTAVFCMRHIKGFDTQILEALHSSDDEIQYEAVKAAGEWSVEGAWTGVLRIAKDPAADTSLRIAAIEAVANIRPEAAFENLDELTQSDDEDIAEAADEAISMAEIGSAPEDEEDEDPEHWIN